MDLLGFDIGGTKCAALLGNEKGDVFFRKAIPTSSPEKTVDLLLEMARSFGGSPVAAGVSCGGPLDEKNGIILSPPNLPGWDEIHITDILSERLSMPVRLYNDANACALAEWKLGAGIGSENMIFFTFGTGFGAGLILNGRLYSGANGNAGEVGHWRLFETGPVGYGKTGSFEGFCSGGGLKQLARTYALEMIQKGTPPGFCPNLDALDGLSAKSVAEAAHAGDPVAAEVYRKCGEMLGKGLALVVDLLNPDTIVIGSVFERAEDLLRPSMEAVLRKECLPQILEAVRIVPAALGDSIGDKAALIAAAFAADSLSR